MGAVGYTSGDPRKLNVAGYAQGDVLAANSVGTLVPVAVGTDNQVLTVDPTESTFVDWESGGGGGGAVDSVFGRVGDVVAESGDYTSAQVGADAAGTAAAAVTTHSGAVDPHGDRAYADSVFQREIARYNSGPLTGGNVTAPNNAFATLMSPDPVIAAVAGDHLEILIEHVCAATPAPQAAVAFDAVTRVGGVDVNYVSSGTNVALRPGTRGAWYVGANMHAGPRPVTYVVQPADVSGGTVTLRFLVAGDGNTRTVHATSVLPGRIVIKNFGQ